MPRDGEGVRQVSQALSESIFVYRPRELLAVFQPRFRPSVAPSCRLHFCPNFQPRFRPSAWGPSCRPSFRPSFQPRFRPSVGPSCRLRFRLSIQPTGIGKRRMEPAFPPLLPLLVPSCPNTFTLRGAHAARRRRCPASLVAKMLQISETCTGAITGQFSAHTQPYVDISAKRIRYTSFEEKSASLSPAWISLK